MKKDLLSPLLFAVVGLSSAAALAQQRNAPVAEEVVATDAKEGTSVEEQLKQQGETISQLQKQLQENQKAQEQLQENEKAHAEREQQLKQRVEELEAKQKEEEDFSLDEWGEGVDASFKRFLDVYGFFDFNFIKYFMDEGDAARLVFEENSSFAFTHLNLYVKSQMTATLMALIELRFTYMPHGSVKDYANFERESTEVMEPVIGETFNLGGVAIERVHLTYSPLDWLQITAGHFLTPFGIWNVEHGSPVLFGVMPPYFQVRKMVPLSQTGLQVLGRFFPADFIFLDYAVTLSNGRGFMSEVLDLDENKAVGLKLKLIFNGRNKSLAIGEYTYYGSYTDNTKSIELSDPGADFFIQPVVSVTESYNEFIQTADLQVDLFGLSLRSEYVYRMVLYDTTRPLAPEELLNLPNGGSSPWTDYVASFMGHSVYGLVAYELPIKELIGGVRISPYFMYEYCKERDTDLAANITQIRTGLNVKPSPFIVLKGEYAWVIRDESVGGFTLEQLIFQLAVAF